jgi:hypothetical protein
MCVKGWMTAPAAMAALLDHAVRADLHAVAQHHLPSKTQPTSISTSAARAARRAGRSAPGRAGARRLHQRVGLLRAGGGAPDRPAAAGLLTPSTSASSGGWVATTGSAFGHRHGDDVGQVVLALGVVVVQSATASGERRVGAAIMPV